MFWLVLALGYADPPLPPLDNEPPLCPVPIVQKAKAAPAVAARTFPRNASHNCPQCGRQQLVIYGAGPVAGTHLHRCPVDGQIWFH